MNKDLSSSSPKNKAPIEINLDEFMISEESFKPMTKGLGFHHDTKRPSFKPAPKEVKAFGAPKASMAASLNTMPSASVKSSTGAPSANHIPSGLEAFYGTKPVESKSIFEEKVEVKTEKVVSQKAAPQLSQFFAWVIDVLVIASFVALTEALLVLASGIELRMYSRLISSNDLAIFSAAIFSIYYLLYFTILDLGASPGKTVFGIKLAKTNGREVSVKHTFFRALISLVSGLALFLPMLLDFQGRLSDTKLVK
jgi:uncharacterized RDD family membrane protein YckC